MNIELKSYQKIAKDYILTHPRCMLALDMGLGKTATTLCALAELKEDFGLRRVLVVAPKHVAEDTWPSEIERWNFPFTYSVAVGSPERKRDEALFADTDVLLINRENLPWLLKKHGERVKNEFNVIVLDESSSFKSSSSERFKSLRKFSAGFDRVIELTGTPRARGIEDLWPQIYLLDNGSRLGRNMTEFRKTYEMPTGRTFGKRIELVPRPGSDEAINKKISDLCMSMSAKDYLDVPEYTIIDHEIRFNKPLQKQYNDFEANHVMQLQDSDIAGVNAGALVGKLQQFCQGAIYGDDKIAHDIHRDKLSVLAEILEATDEPVLVFYWFKFDGIRLQNEFKDLNPTVLGDPETNAKWNRGEIKLGLLQPGSAGHGLNLQFGGHIIVWYGLTWDLELYQQANGRLYRTGQKNSVQIHRILVKQTVDMDIVRSLEKKNVGQSGMIEAIRARVAEKGIM